MVFGLFLWLLIALIPLQTSPEFVVREIRACCHHQITLKCADHRSKIAIIQARYVVEREGSSSATTTVTDEEFPGSKSGLVQQEQGFSSPPSSSNSISLWDIDVKFAHDFMQDGRQPTEFNSPDWLEFHNFEEKRRLLYPKVTPIPKIPFGLNFSDDRVIEMPPYEIKFLDKDTIWRQPLFSVIHSETSESESNSLPSPFFPSSKKCLSYESLSTSSSATKVVEKVTKPSWHFKDLRAYFNQRCSGRSKCEVYLLHNKQRDQDLTRVCHLMPDGRIVVKYLCYNVSSGDVHSKCNVDVTPAREGFLLNPGYPDLYQGDRPCQWRLHVPLQKILLVFFDISLRGKERSQCRDELVVNEDKTKLFSTCGDHSSAIAVLSETDRVNVTLIPKSRMAFPKRGFLVYYRVIGCMKPEGPENSYTVFRNATHAYITCNVGYVFADSLIRNKWLLCNPLDRTWTNSSHNCEDIQSLLTSSSKTSIEEILRNNPAVWPVIHASSMDTVVSDYIIPISVILFTLLIHGIIILLIWRQRRRLKELEKETLEAIEELSIGTPEESTFTFPSLSVNDLWDQDDQDPTLTTLTLQDTPSSSARKAEIETCNVSNSHFLTNLTGATSNGHANGGAGGYVNGTILPTLYGFPRSTPV